MKANVTRPPVYAIFRLMSEFRCIIQNYMETGFHIAISGFFVLRAKIVNLTCCKDARVTCITF